MDNLIRLNYATKVVESLDLKYLPTIPGVSEKLSTYVTSVEDINDSFEGVFLDVIIEEALFMTEKELKTSKFARDFLKDLHRVTLFVYPTSSEQIVKYNLIDGNYFTNGDKYDPCTIAGLNEESFTPKSGGQITLFRENIFDSDCYVNFNKRKFGRRK